MTAGSIPRRHFLGKSVLCVHAAWLLTVWCHNETIFTATSDYPNAVGSTNYNMCPVDRDGLETQDCMSYNINKVKLKRNLSCRLNKQKEMF